MNLIFKFIIKNILEKKFRTFLILISITISSALLLLSQSLTDKLVDSTIERMKQNFGSSEIIIREGSKSLSPYFTIKQANKYENKYDYIIGSLEGSGYYKYSINDKYKFDIYGFDMEDIKTMNPLKLEKEYNLYPFSGNKILISKKMSQKYGFDVGDNLDLEVNNKKYRFTICGISYPQGFFLEEDGVTNIIMPKSKLVSIYNIKGRYSTAYIKLKNENDKEFIIEKLSKLYSKYSVKEPFSPQEALQEIKGLSTSFMMIIIIIFCISIFIIYSSFNVITLERLPVIGTFRSVGATKKMTNLVLLAESSIYGIIGGIIGCSLGIFVYSLICYLTTPDWEKGSIYLGYINKNYILNAFISAVMLSFLSVLIPIFRISKIPIKDIILNKIETKNKTNKGRINFKQIVGISFLIASIMLPNIAPKNVALYLTILSLLLAISSIILMIPEIVNLFTMLLEKVYIILFGNESILAIKNLKEDKSILNNIALLSIGICSILMINMVSYSVVSEISNNYSNRIFDISMSYSKSDKSFKQSLSGIDGVAGVYGVYEEHDVEIYNSKQAVRVIQGVDSNKHLDYWKMDMEGNQKEIFKKLDEGRNILITNTLADMLNVRIGDKVTFRMKAGIRSYKVVGYFDTITNFGNYAIVSGKYLKSDICSPFYYRLYLKTKKEPKIVSDNIKKKFSKIQYDIKIMKAHEKEDKETYQNLFLILKAFSFMTLVIGIFGVINNLIISFIQRKRIFAVLRSVGAQKKQINRMLFIESLTGGVVGSFIGSAYGVLLIYIMIRVLKLINVPIPIYYDYKLFVTSFIVGILVMYISSLSLSLKTSKYSIIEAIKYE